MALDQIDRAAIDDDVSRLLGHEPMQFEPVSIDELDSLEESIGFLFPDDYRYFMTCYGSATQIREWVTPFLRQDHVVWERVFSPAWIAGECELVDSVFGSPHTDPACWKDWHRDLVPFAGKFTEFLCFDYQYSSTNPPVVLLQQDGSAECGVSFDMVLYIAESFGELLKTTLYTDHRGDEPLPVPAPTASQIAWYEARNERLGLPSETWTRFLS